MNKASEVRCDHSNHSNVIIEKNPVWKVNLRVFFFFFFINTDGVSEGPYLQIFSRLLLLWRVQGGSIRNYILSTGQTDKMTFLFLSAKPLLLMKEYIFQHSPSTTLLFRLQSCVYIPCLFAPQDILENETCCFKAARVLPLCKKLNKINSEQIQH